MNAGLRNSRRSKDGAGLRRLWSLLEAGVSGKEGRLRRSGAACVRLQRCRLPAVRLYCWPRLFHLKEEPLG